MVSSPVGFDHRENGDHHNVDVKPDGPYSSDAERNRDDEAHTEENEFLDAEEDMVESEPPKQVVLPKGPPPKLPPRQATAPKPIETEFEDLDLDDKK
ncbi:hypothetical protein NQ176_g9529 [Zarea fungicola]|uniref:Uncharacterized protein n=1 Tax=Zarea fungicola TaxID=93591 RepID=A0ACC1MMZ9_9HYPO|nr:hypothetical protein NQ176_g9529 [Lecanicillium fungicola]